MNFREFLDKCSLIATQHPRSVRIDFENDVCVKAGINSFKDSLEYRDQYITISCALDDVALYVEAMQPVQKIIALVDGTGRIIIMENEYQYLVNLVDALYKQLGN